MKKIHDDLHRRWTGYHMGARDNISCPSLRILLCKIFGHLHIGRARRGDGQCTCYFCFEVLCAKDIK